MDLFDYMRSTNMEKESPLAARMRPTTLDEVVGQKHIIGEDKERGKLPWQRLLPTPPVLSLCRLMRRLLGKKIWKKW